MTRQFVQPEWKCRGGLVIKIVHILGVIALLFIGFPAYGEDVVSPYDLVGTWINSDQDTRGITKILIITNETQEVEGITIKVWGKCHPQDCEWVPFPLVYDTTPYFAVYQADFKTTTLNFEPLSESLLNVHTMSMFTDGTGRNHGDTYAFTRQ